MVEYINRYKDKYTFTKQEDGSVLWEGSFQYTRVGYPNVYKIAYQTVPEGWRRATYQNDFDREKYTVAEYP